MTCVRGLRDYMICTNCYESFSKDAIEVGELFNCSSDTAIVCSEKCKKEITERVSNGTWMNHYVRFPGTSE